MVTKDLESMKCNLNTESITIIVTAPGTGAYTRGLAHSAPLLHFTGAGRLQRVLLRY